MHADSSLISSSEESTSLVITIDTKAGYVLLQKHEKSSAAKHMPEKGKEICFQVEHVVERK